MLWRKHRTPLYVQGGCSLPCVMAGVCVRVLAQLEDMCLIRTRGVRIYIETWRYMVPGVFVVRAVL